MIVICSDFIAQDHERYLKLATVTVQFAQSFSLFSDRHTHTHTHTSAAELPVDWKLQKKKKERKKTSETWCLRFSAILNCWFQHFSCVFGIKLYSTRRKKKEEKALGKIRPVFYDQELFIIACFWILIPSEFLEC